ncbi:MAG: glycosyltransferase family 2 protein [Promethearchaeota archaeon]
MVEISVLMPSFNHSQFIREAIESVLDQTYKDFEFIIIDDCSSDNSVEIIKLYKKKDNRIRLICHSKNMGIAKTQNELIELARGKYIAFINSDDVWIKNKLEKQMKILKKNEDLIVWSDGIIIDKNSKYSKLTFLEKYKSNDRKKRGNIFYELLKGNYIFFSSLILKKSNLGDLRFNDKFKLISDYLFELKLASNYRYYATNEPLAKYRLHDYNTINSDKTRLVKELILTYLIILEDFQNKLPRKIKGFLISEIIEGFILLNEIQNAKPYVFKAFKLNFFNINNFFDFFRCFINLKILLVFLSKILKIYKNLLILLEK